MRQKTIRFYEQSREDMAAYEKLGCFREYGFNSARELMIAAINDYSYKGISSENNIDIDRLAECIVRKMKNNGTTFQMCDKEVANVEDSNNDVFDKALSFMESL